MHRCKSSKFPSILITLFVFRDTFRPRKVNSLTTVAQPTVKAPETRVEYTFSLFSSRLFRNFDSIYGTVERSFDSNPPFSIRGRLVFVLPKRESKKYAPMDVFQTIISSLAVIYWCFRNVMLLIYRNTFFFIHFITGMLLKCRLKVCFFISKNILIIFYLNFFQIKFFLNYECF